MLFDGEKWACEACVRGHRVSTCHHHGKSKMECACNLSSEPKTDPRIDRPLIRIEKKGRPITQCAHCRGLRESRTTHIKCECGKNIYDEANFQFAGEQHLRSEHPSGNSSTQYS